MILRPEDLRRRARDLRNLRVYPKQERGGGRQIRVMTTRREVINDRPREVVMNRFLKHFFPAKLLVTSCRLQRLRPPLRSSPCLNRILRLGEISTLRLLQRLRTTSVKLRTGHLYSFILWISESLRIVDHITPSPNPGPSLSALRHSTKGSLTTTCAKGANT